MGIDAEMFVRVKGPVSPEELAKFNHYLFCCFGPRPFAHWDDKQPAQITPQWEQDGPPIRPRKGETFVRIFLVGRYYGEGYERGNCLQLCDIADAAERWWDGRGAVWYGGDSSGVVAEPFGENERAILRAHFFKVQHLPYTRAFNEPSANPADNRTCSRCNVAMTRNGWGPNKYGHWYCPCGEVVNMRNGKDTRSTQSVMQRRYYDLRNRAIELLEKADPGAYREISELLHEVANV